MKSKIEEIEVEAPPTLPEPGFVRTDMGRPKAKKEKTIATPKAVKESAPKPTKETVKKEAGHVHVSIGATTNGKFKFQKEEYNNSREAIIAVKQHIDELLEKGLKEIILSFKK